MSENNPITVFASHVFEESDDYLRLFEFLEGLERFYYVNVSKPENIPQSGGLQAIKDELSEMEGIKTVAGSPEAKTVDVEWEAPASVEKIKETLKEINYPAA